MLLNLPDVTLVCFENRDLEKATHLMEDMMKLASFKEIVWKRSHKDYEGFRKAELTAWRSVHSSHMLYIHADGFILNPEIWRSDWLNLDYIGAPWPEDWETKYRVGNGGFSLRSRLLAKRVEELGWQDMNNDVLICQTYREQLENEDFKFASVEEAAKFSVEWPVIETPEVTFGFHGIWPLKKDPPSYYILSHNMQ